MDLARPPGSIVTLHMPVKGKRPVSHLLAGLNEADGLIEVGHMNDDADLD